MNLVLPNNDTCVKNEKIYCRLACSKEKSLSVSENFSSFGRNSSLKLMTKTIISIKTMPGHFNQYPIQCLCECSAIFTVTMIFSITLWTITTTIVVDVIA